MTRSRLREPRVYSSAWLSLFPAVYLAHLIDERYFWIGTADFATRYLGIYFTNAAWWAVNVPSLLLLTVATVLIARGVWPQWLALALALHLALHGLGRVPTSLWTLEIAPGLVTGLLLCTPLAAATLWKGRRAFSSRQIAWGVLAGVASFQPFWHFLLLPVLPSAPAVAWATDGTRIVLGSVLPFGVGGAVGTMPVSIRIDPETGVAIAACSGVLRLQEAREGAQALWETPGWKGRSVAWDFRGAEFDVSSSETREIAQFILQQQPAPPPAKVAFITPRDADFGMARMFEVFRQDPRTAFRVFREFDEAISWARGVEPGPA